MENPHGVGGGESPAVGEESPGGKWRIPTGEGGESPGGR